MMRFEILSDTPVEMREGAVIDYRIRLGPFPMRWRTVSEQLVPQSHFIDSQHKGPYASWWHEHLIQDDGNGGTQMTDRVWFRAGFGPLGRLAEILFVEPMLQRIFSYRTAVLRQRFGIHPSSRGTPIAPHT